MTPSQPPHNGQPPSSLDAIGERLRQLFAHVMDEPPPPELLALLAALDSEEGEP
jgi:hypothetical protein